MSPGRIVLGGVAGLVLSFGVATTLSGQSAVSVADTMDASVRVIVIDPGHGGRDPGTTGISGVREKDVALAVAIELAEILSRDPFLEVHLTRTTDRYLAPWERGEMAMTLKGERVGAFISLHANAMPADSVTRGFEVFFLSEARTEHEERVVAMENAAPHMEGVQHRVAADSELDGILMELMNLDTHRWSSVLAEAVRGGLADVAVTRDLGVRQGPFAVITNTLMPGVLVELGYLTNRMEAGRLTDPLRQRQLALGLAEGVYDFFSRYPPGEAAGLGRSANGRNPGPRP